MPDTALAIQPVSGFISAKIDLDLSGPLGDGIHKALNDALDEHHVLFFCGQDLDAQGIKRVTEVFAPLVPFPYISPSHNNPDTIAVLKEAGGAKIANFSDDWHFYFSFLDEASQQVCTLRAGGASLWRRRPMGHSDFSLRATER